MPFQSKGPLIFVKFATVKSWFGWCSYKIQNSIYKIEIKKVSGAVFIVFEFFVSINDWKYVETNWNELQQFLRLWKLFSNSDLKNLKLLWIFDYEQLITWKFDHSTRLSKRIFCDAIILSKIVLRRMFNNKSVSRSIDDGRFPAVFLVYHFLIFVPRYFGMRMRMNDARQWGFQSSSCMHGFVLSFDHRFV